MAADDILNSPQGYPADLDSPMSGNRPASGARRATPGEVLSQGFQGAQNAGDFLGLDTEFTDSQDPNQGYGVGTPLDLVAPPSTQMQPDEPFAPAEPAPLPPSDPVQEFAQAPSAFEFGEDLGSEESEASSGGIAPSGKGRLFVGALLLLALVGGGVYYGPELISRYSGSRAEVAKAPAPSSGTKSPASGTPNAKAEPTGAKGGIEPVESSEPVRAPETASAEPKTPSGAAALPRAGKRPQTERTPEPTPSSSEPVPLASEPAAVTPVAGAPRPNPIGQASFPNVANYEWASEDQLELIWRGSEVPLEAIHAPAKTLMPRVGNVRVFTIAGDVFEGRLYAVGQDLVWIDGKPGRIGLDGSRVERIDVLPPEAEGTVTNEDTVVGGRRVRVRVPGGMLYGSVLKAEGEDVTLALEDGGKVRVKASDIQDLGSGRAIVVSR